MERTSTTESENQFKSELQQNYINKTTSYTNTIFFTVTMKLLAILPLFLAATTLADEKTDCKSCFPATSSDCVDASGQIPTDGSTLDDNSNTKWTSGSCTIEFIPNGGSPNGNDVLGVAQSFLSDCCSGDSCSGVAYDTGSSTALQNGCLCFHEEGKVPCICGAGTPSMTCI